LSLDGLSPPAKRRRAGKSKLARQIAGVRFRSNTLLNKQLPPHLGEQGRIAAALAHQPPMKRPPIY
jgi:hypothetical protein